MNFRATWRLVLLALVLGAGLFTALFFPLLTRRARTGFKRMWATTALRALGVRLQRSGARHAVGLLVSNHVSWLDVLAIAAVAPARFVCKQDVAAWPVLGWFVEKTGAIFVRRNSARAAARAMHEATQCLRGGAIVAVFPEGTTSDGTGVLAFRSMFFQAALNAGCAVQPIALGYSDPAARFVGDMTFIESLRLVVAANGLVVSLRVLPPLAMLTRRQAAARAQAAIRAAVHAGLEIVVPDSEHPAAGFLLHELRQP